MEEIKIQQMAIKSYKAFCKSSGNLQTWDNLPPDVQNHWVVATKETIKNVAIELSEF